MMCIRKPGPDEIRTFLGRQRQSPFSYPHVGATKGQPPEGWVTDHNRVRLGTGQADYEAACAAVRRWEMFRLGWIETYGTADAPIVPGQEVAVLARLAGTWWLNACRVVYVVDEVAPVRRYGFAYGTLPDHAERGEERFTVEWRREDDSVWYDLLAFSRPGHWLARLAYPLARRFQRRFAAESMAAMKRAVEVDPSS
jgi:uncharacterized protein (UPF0548 family)